MMSSRSKDALLAAVLAVLGIWPLILTLRPGFSGWFLREDSRFFANGLFSFYDLAETFLSPQNSMGQYRPITKLLWGWPGAFDPLFYHFLSFLLTALAALALARLVYGFFRSYLAAVGAAILFILLPVNQKPLYWISAWHNVAAVLFVAGACALRMEEGRRWRVCSLLCLYLGIASRESAFVAAPVMLTIDWLQGRGWRRSIEVVAVAGVLFTWLFVWHSPLARAGVMMAGTPTLAWAFFNNSFWGMSDAVAIVDGAWKSALTISVLVITLLAPLARREFLPGMLLGYLGAAPFLLIGVRMVEYGSMAALGFVFTIAGVLSSLPRILAAPAFAGAIVLFTVSGVTMRSFYEEYFVRQSQELRGIVEGLREVAAASPPFRAIEITSVPQGKIAMTLHFLHPGLDELIPERLFLFTPETLGISDGTGLSDPRSSPWIDQLRGVTPPLKVGYTAEGFRVLRD